MKIDTDLVKTKSFSSSIKPSVLKHSQEYRVLATLRYLYPDKYDTMIPGESPDLQDHEKSTGIEVTSAVNEADMKASRALSELNDGQSKDIRRYKNIIESSGFSIVSSNDDKVIITTSGTANGEKRFFQDSIRKKTNKLHQYRTDLQIVGLAILLPEIPTSYAEKHLSEWISDVFGEFAANEFDFVYVISHCFCLYYEPHANTTEKHSLTKEESRLLATIGRMTAEGELSMIDEEWL